MNLAVLASGGGSNFDSIVEASRSGRLPGSVVLCVTDRPTAGVVGRASNHGIETAVVDTASPDYASGEGLLGLLRLHGVDFVALAGYLRMIPGTVVDAFANRMTNIHPALLPAFGGKGMFGRHVHEAVIDRGVKWTGVTVHLVDRSYDTGPIVAQVPVAVRDDDTPDSLSRRVLAVEHRLYPEVLTAFAQDRVRVNGRRVRIIGPTRLSDALTA